MQLCDSNRVELSPGEQVGWSGEPRQGIVICGSDAFTIPFSLLWAGIAVFSLVLAAWSNAPLPLVQFGVLFVVLGVNLALLNSSDRYRTFGEVRCDGHAGVECMRVDLRAFQFNRHHSPRSAHAATSLQ